MITLELIAYIRKQLAAGIPKENITGSLSQNGWPPQDIAQAFTAASVPATAPSVTRNVKQPSSVGVKVFLSVVFVIASAAYALFQYIANPAQPPMIAISPPSSQQNVPTGASTPGASNSSAIQPDQSQSANTTVANQTPVASAPPPTPTPAPASIQNTYIPSRRITPTRRRPQNQQANMQTAPTPAAPPMHTTVRSR